MRATIKKNRERKRQKERLKKKRKIGEKKGYGREIKDIELKD